MAERERIFKPTVAPLDSKVIIGFAADHGIGKHSAAKKLLETVINAMPEVVRQRYINRYNNLTEEQRRNPKL